ncbi:hypothetical protein A2303_05120 [Candidatus Falkowbacteria bacterium RIFOXYB2_FULL_47_14]|uniref:Dipeptidylpeptidase IV N-terminal domain-containing protein n=1 Tax=Candidatus Falkowbacteria bacterium RIFOXYA2_FULL_47_19 TaxID=1797994 RepID=A0A1F5SJ59_9BACT|nr:MAG: hypothetical protein A2227_06500 [Candidatus Falkowbacteria bacterium RIFOXYA2_FULL_47_19]OGF35739.1 MAG: hypothetical protein A2468_05175 [Candidatus Falkowbacteria bacterium RIFOXYC2_FULL_46_15]OGF43298.1 MAG: hypothetical protein A2303_05120 [Candidatus Falkowbacteria bacterium RIFOXYB2_FULL_47_14]
MEFLSKYKKILLALGFLLITVLLGYLLYAMFFKSSLPVTLEPEPGGTATGTGAGFPDTASGTGKIIHTETGTDRTSLPGAAASPVARGGLTTVKDLEQTGGLGPTLGSNGSDLQFYDPKSEKFYRLGKDGELTPLSDKKFHEVRNITWASDKNTAILEYPDGANILYDFSADKQITLPQHWENFDFSPSGDKIVMKSIGLDPDNRWLAVANKDGSGSRIIEDLGENAGSVYPDWSPNNQIIATYAKGVGFDRQEVFFVGLNDENFKSTVVEGRGFEPLWSPEGDRLLYSVYSTEDNLKPGLWVVNAEGESIGTGRRKLNVETWAHKCAFGGSEGLYCAVPEKLSEGAGLIPELGLRTKDNLYKIDPVTGQKKLLAVPDGTYNISNVIISDNGYYLYFTDEKTGKLHQINLK